MRRFCMVRRGARATGEVQDGGAGQEQIPRWRQTNPAKASGSVEEDVVEGCYAARWVLGIWQREEEWSWVGRDGDWTEVEIETEMRTREGG